MPTVINNPSEREREGNAAAAIVTGVVVIILVLLFFLYGLPGIRDNGTDINLPNQVDVNTGGGNQ